MEQRRGSSTGSGSMSSIIAPVSLWPTSLNAVSSVLQQNHKPASLYSMQKEATPLVTQSHYSPVRSPTSSRKYIFSTPKVAIPRIAVPNERQERRRAKRACEPCRQRKVKCNSQRPTCTQCAYAGKRCAYEEVKRVRNEEKIKQLTKKVERYENVLQDLVGYVDAPTAHKIRRTLKVGTVRPNSIHILTTLCPTPSPSRRIFFWNAWNSNNEFSLFFI